MDWIEIVGVLVAGLILLAYLGVKAGSDFSFHQHICSRCGFEVYKDHRGRAWVDYYGATWIPHEEVCCKDVNLRGFSSK